MRMESFGIKGTPAAIAEAEALEPVSPSDRMFMAPDFYMTVCVVIGFANPIDIDAFLRVLDKSLLRHKRFISIMKTGKDGKVFWIPTKINLKDHVIAAKPEEMESENFVEEYIAKLQDAKPFDMSKPLWELHVLNKRSKEAEACGIFRFHHALGDGTSLMSLFLACTRRTDCPDALPTVPKYKQRPLPSFFLRLWSLVLLFWYSLMDLFELLATLLWRGDTQTIIKGVSGCEYWPKAFSMCAVSLEDMKIVKQASNGTINAVVLAMLASGFRRYLLQRTTPLDKKDLLENVLSRALVVMNTRKNPGIQEVEEMLKKGSHAGWGNHLGYMMFPLELKKLKNPVQYIQRASAQADRKRLSLHSRFTYFLAWYGDKFARKVLYKMALQTTLTCSNVVGPVEEISFAGNPITYIIATIPGVPQALVVHVVSYNGTLRFGVNVKKDIIPDPEVLCQCFVDALQEMKDATLQR